MEFENDEQKLIEKLLLPTPIPFGFKRNKPTAFRFQPYSRKLRRRLDIYSPIMYDMWVILEWSPEIEFFNERVDKIPVAGKDGRVFHWAPHMVSVSIKTEYFVHAINVNESNESGSLGINGETYIKNWADVNFFSLKIWTPEVIRSNPIELANRKQLYAYLSNPEGVVSPVLKEKVLLILRRYRKTTIDDLVQTLDYTCTDSALQVVADLIMGRTIFSDIHKFPFGWTTEISCFHEFA